MIGIDIRDPGDTRSVIWDARFEALPLSTAANAADLRAALAAMGLTLTRASSATVQTSATAVVTSSIGVDDPRVGDGGYGRGLVLEESRTNQIPIVSTVGGWGAGSLSTDGPYGVAPDGAGVAYRHRPASGGFSRYYGGGTIHAPPFTSSLWLRSPDGGGPLTNQIDYWDFSGERVAAPTTESWARYTRTYAAGASGNGLLCPSDARDWSGSGGIAAAARDCVSAFHQFEDGLFATEFILTAAASVTRAADRLRLDTTARVVRSGRIAIELDFIAKGGRSSYTGSPSLLAVDGSNYAIFSAATGALTIAVGGVTFGTTAISWNANDRVRVFLAIGGGTSECWTKIGEAAAVNRSGGSSLGNFPASSAIDLLNFGAAQNVSAWVQRVRAYAPGRRPAWAA